LDGCFEVKENDLVFKNIEIEFTEINS